MKRNTLLIGTLGWLLAALTISAESGFYPPLTPASAEAAESAGGRGAGGSGQNLSEIGKRLANPFSDVWAMFTEFDFSFSDGDLNTGSGCSASECSSSPSCLGPSTAKARTNGN